MKENISITAAKARLSGLINRLIHRDDTIFITKKGKSVAVLMPVTAYRDLMKKEKPDLLSARGVLAEWDREIDEIVARAYEERDRSKDREVRI